MIEPMEPERVRTLQTMLRVISRVIPRQISVIPDGYYTAQTQKAVRCFQQRHGLPVTGLADAETWEHITEEYEKTRTDAQRAAPIQICLRCGQVLRRGAHSHKIFLLQTMLLTLSRLAREIPCPEHTGVMDELTCRSVTAFQLKAGLRPTGEVDKQTWKALTLHFAAASDELSRRTGESE